MQYNMRRGRQRRRGVENVQEERTGREVYTLSRRAYDSHGLVERVVTEGNAGKRRETVAS